MIKLIYILDIAFTVYTLMLLARVLLSWFPQAERYSWARTLSLLTDPYLNLFRRWIPPLGMLDLSPLVAFFTLQIAQWLLFALLTKIV